MTPQYITIKRHKILLIMKTLKFFFFLLPIGLLVWIFYSYSNMFPSDFSNLVVLPIALISINYVFLQIILNFIDYYGRVMLISNHAIIIIHSTLLLIDDIEFMKLPSILKVDVERHGFLTNIFNYGHLILEQTNEIRRIHYIPYPHTICQIINSNIARWIPEISST